MRDFSIDLETLHNRYNAAIISIGAVQFNADTGKIGETFYREIDFDSAVRAGKVNGSTLAWWMRQEAKAKRIFSEGKNKIPLAVALDDLRTWILKVTPSGEDVRPWGNGSSFDITILEHAYENGAVGLKEPWDFWNIRDMRTIVDVCDFRKEDWPFPADAVAHNALDDAMRQAQIISACWMKARHAMFGKPASINTKVDKRTVSKPVAPIVPDDDEEL